MKVAYEKITMGERIVVLFSINTLLTPAHIHTRTQTHIHHCQTCIKCACYGLVFFSMSANVFVFFSSRRCYLIQFLSAGTQTCCQHHRHHPCLDILEPPENDGLIVLCGRGEGRLTLKEDGGVSAHGLFFLSCLHNYLCPSTSHPLKVCACL